MSARAGSRAATADPLHEKKAPIHRVEWIEASQGIRAVDRVGGEVPPRGGGPSDVGGVRLPALSSDGRVSGGLGVAGAALAIELLDQITELKRLTGRL